MKTTNEFLNKVKQVLDGANWSYQFSHPDNVNGDEEKAISYLDGQKFSIGKIKEFTNEINEDDLDENSAEYVAAWIADGLAFDRVRKYLYNSSKKHGNGWYLPESFIFQINQ